MKKVALAPEELEKTLALVSKLARAPKLLDEYRWAYTHGYAQASSSAFDGAKVRGHESDSTLDVIENAAKARSRAAAIEVSRQVDVAQKALGAAVRSLRDSMGRRVDPDRQMRDRHPIVDDRELADAHAAQDRRRRRGEGFGQG